MSQTVGIFEHENRVLDAIKKLHEAGMKQDEIRVIVNDRDNVPLLAAREDIHLEVLYEFQGSGGNVDDRDLPLAVAPIATGYPVGNTAVNNGPAGVIITGYDGGDRASSEEIMQRIGIPSQISELCGRAIESGKCVVLADSSSGIDAQSLLSRLGAEIIS